MAETKPGPIAWLFTAAIFVGSALLFLVQPMVAKMLLPAYGGTPAVWNTSMVFFQAALLLGYGYAHLSYRWLGPKVQPFVHLALLVVAAISLPAAFSAASTSIASPALRLVVQLAMGVGLPFFVVSAGAPLLQRWYATTRAPGSKDPYFLYAASNVASIAALLAYPVLLEPTLPLKGQSMTWTVGYGVLGICILACAGVVLGSHRRAAEASEPTEITAAPTTRQVLYWIALSFVPSSLLLGVTTYLTTNLASAPLLWVIPLVLYLLTFVLAFSAKRKVQSNQIGRLVSMLMAPMLLVIVLEASDPILALACLHLIVFTLGALMCHTRLNETRPDAGHLTAFYFWISVGGVLGGIFNALLAPVLFDSLAEYPIALVALILLVPREKSIKPNWIDAAVPIGVGFFTGIAVLIANSAGLGATPVRTGVTLGIPALASFAFADRPIRYGLCIGAVFLAAKIFQIGSTGDLLLTERSFFGVHRVLSSDSGKYHDLMHGNTIHGKQSTDPARTREALTYYHRTGPIGQVMETLQSEKRIRTVGLVGMGVGSLASYGKFGQTFTFYEIDPDVLYIARDSGLFSFIKDSAANIEVVLDDARLSLAKANQPNYDLLVLDAFSSDSIPMHLLTVEAIQMYLDKIGANGLLAFHISNRYLELRPVLAAAAKKLNLSGLFQEDLAVTDEEKRDGKFPSTWVLLAPKTASLEPFSRDPRWQVLEAAPGDEPWTDDFSNLIKAFLAGMQRDH